MKKKLFAYAKYLFKKRRIEFKPYIVLTYFAIILLLISISILITIYYSKNARYLLSINIFLTVIFIIYSPLIAVQFFYWEDYNNYEKEVESNPIKIHQTENLQEYENIRTQFTLHNIKNAVINANNYMDILRKGKMDLTIATENIQVCLDRIDEILEVFKDSDYAQKRTEFRLEELFTTFQMLYHSTMIRRDIQFEVIYQNDVVKSQIVNQSFYDMFQIFNNLVINSRKALEQMDIKQITVFADMEGQNDLIFKVCDTGIGISSSNKSKIFDLKFSTTGGDGIGLVYVKEVLKEMRGDIRLIEPFQNFSTTFEVRIPIQKM